MKFVLKNGLLILSVCVLCLVALEGMTRLFLDDGMLYELEMWKYAREVKVRDTRPDVGHRHRGNAQAELMGVTVRTNALGARSADIKDKAAAGVARIAFVGDSITLGWGVAEQETFAHQVIAQLTAAGRKVEGINLGVGNYNTSQELALFKEVGARLKPDIIVLSYFINDAEPMPRYPVDHGTVTRWLDEHSAAWVVLGARLVVFNIPELRELRPYPFDDVTAKVRKVVEGRGVSFIDLLPTVETLDPSSLWVTVPDPHPNGRAASAFARRMVPEISDILDDLCRSQSLC
jgi:lysophospholipase L1-like esterase